MERHYDFRKRMLEIHRGQICDPGFVPGNDWIGITDRYAIVIPDDADRVIETAAEDLQDYLRRSLEVSVKILSGYGMKDGEPAIVIRKGPCGKDVPGAYRIEVQAGLVVLTGYDARGCLQACFQLEDRMNRIRAPYLVPGTEDYAPVFSPRMVHSGYSLDQFPDAHLSAIAHAGMDAILVFVKDVDRTPAGYLDFNDLIYRAGKYALDVYAYSYYESSIHPDDPGAFAFYDGTYGRLFRECPGFKGVVLVGESVEFPSKDPRVSPFRYYNNTIDGLPTGKPTPGWFPCEDYDRWLKMLQKVIYRYRPDADIVFWTYNWGKCSKEDRLKLIDSLPEGISLMATFEMFECRKIEGQKSIAVDYTIAFPEAGQYFISEAERCKARGIRLYTQANSAGLTWDYGVIPYDPFPQLWVRRYESMLDAHEKYGLCGVMESHHYGFWPSFISKIEKMMFTQPHVSGPEAIRIAAAECFGAENCDDAVAVWDLLSRAHTYYPCSAEDQYGPFRIGPAYPLVFHNDVQIPTVPYAHFGGNAITFTDYAADPFYKITGYGMKNTGLVQQRIPGEIRCLEKMIDLLAQGREKIQAISDRLSGPRRDDALRLINMISFMERTALTAIHVRQWTWCKRRFMAQTDVDALLRILDEMLAIGEREISNAEGAIPLVEADSRLGWEPSMEYIGDAWHIRWKIRQTRQVLEQEIPLYRRIVQSQSSDTNDIH